MHPNDIKALTEKVAAEKKYGGRSALVVIRAPQTAGLGANAGFYLARTGQFTAKTPREAAVYDFDRDGVAGQYFQCLLNGNPIQLEEVNPDKN